MRRSCAASARCSRRQIAAKNGNGLAGAAGSARCCSIAALLSRLCTPPSRQSQAARCATAQPAQHSSRTMGSSARASAARQDLIHASASALLRRREFLPASEELLRRREIRVVFTSKKIRIFISVLQLCLTKVILYPPRGGHVLQRFYFQHLLTHYYHQSHLGTLTAPRPNVWCGYVPRPPHRARPWRACVTTLSCRPAGFPEPLDSGPRISL